MISQSKSNYFLYNSFKSFRRELEENCDIVLIELPEIDGYFRRVSYIFRKGLSEEIYARLDQAFMSLRELSDNVLHDEHLFSNSAQAEAKAYTT